MGHHRLVRSRYGFSFPVMSGVEILAPTFLEYWAVRYTLPHTRASWAGVRLARWNSERQEPIVVVCGLAGALAPGLPPGTVLIPEQVGLADGRSMLCDPTLVQAFVAAARTLHFRVDTGPLLTAQTFLGGEDRYAWSQRGFIAADMETGLLAERNLRVATIRVVLDSPEHGISSDWLRPTKALRQPLLWREFFWLSRVAPRYALRAAHVLKVGLGTRPGSIFVE